ncbi:MAG: zinc-dependent alcohol dehydrogenase family protein [Planctomycetota bacterium]|nr:zinc-dependent alcohol dehydrogenase family protein [Planctomycetota bacterium]MDA0921572.1 zinc-dependent alcohol dehydrogenase family protein [Planctomycetota bacterium]MDA1161016.1 zinc-dependent alcohol dehydrogenase family protein [Planctomycetota bacterium]
MKAVVFDATGAPESVLTVKEVSEPDPKHGQVKVRMLCCPINPSDLMFVRGQYTLSADCPATPGFEGVGIVESAGGGLRAKMMVGKRVAVLSRQGGNWAEKNIVPASQVIPFSNLLTGRLTLEQQATFFVNPVTAFVMCREVLRVPAGEWLLQTAAGSVLGHMIIRLGKRFGFKTLCVVRREAQVAELKSAGADATIWFDPEQHSLDQFRAAVAAATGASTERSVIRSAIDCVGGATGSAVIAVLGKRANMLVFGTLSGEPLTVPSRSLMTPGATISGFWLGNYMETLKLTAKLKLVRTVSGLIREGVLASEIGESFQLEDIGSAVRAAETSGRGGKILLNIAAD